MRRQPTLGSIFRIALILFPLACTEEVVFHDTLPVPPVPLDSETSGCECPDIGAYCAAGLCVKPGQCSKSSCDPNYVCNQSEFSNTYTACVCGTDLEASESCAPRCESDSDCEPSFVCRQPEGVCKLRDRCLSHHACSPDEVCGYANYPPNLDEYSLQLWGPECSVPIAARPAGSTCEDALECTSGICRYGTCLDRCDNNATCDASQRCVDGACLPVDGQCESCDALDHWCLASSGACLQSCSVGQDCGASDCTMDPYSQGLFCAEGIARCGKSEFLYEDDDLTTCLVHQTCWIDADCGGDYTCIPISDGVTGYCGRVAPI